eukprot:5500717-Amphidinium_carterae.1
MLGHPQADAYSHPWCHYWPIRELASRCQGLSQTLLAHQAPSVAAVASGIHVAVVAILTLIMQWPDWRLPQRFIMGFATVGVLERSNVYTEVDPGVPRQ